MCNGSKCVGDIEVCDENDDSKNLFYNGSRSAWDICIHEVYPRGMIGCMTSSQQGSLYHHVPLSALVTGTIDQMNKKKVP